MAAADPAAVFVREDGVRDRIMPPPAAVLDLTMDDGAPIRVVRHGNPTGPRVVLSHGNGFASDAYFPFWRLLLGRFDLVLFDFRNHGRNLFHGARGHGYPRFVRDCAAVHAAIVEAWGAKTTIGVFHSMSATTALLAVGEGIWHWNALVLFDPPVAPPEGHPLREAIAAEGDALARSARVRQDRFADPDRLADAIRALPRFRRLAEGAAELIAHSTLRRDPDSGEWRLCCPAPVEAGIYTEVVALPLWQKAGPPVRPLLMVGADPGTRDAPSTARCGEAFCREHGIRHTFIPDTGHLMQFEEPGRCHAVLETFLADNGIAA